MLLFITRKEDNVLGQFVLGSALYANVDLEDSICIPICIFTFEITCKNLCYNGLWQILTSCQCVLVKDFKTTHISLQPRPTLKNSC